MPKLVIVFSLTDYSKAAGLSRTVLDLSQEPDQRKSSYVELNRAHTRSNEIHPKSKEGDEVNFNLPVVRRLKQVG